MDTNTTPTPRVRTWTTPELVALFRPYRGAVVRPVRDDSLSRRVRAAKRAQNN